MASSSTWMVGAVVATALYYIFFYVYIPYRSSKAEPVVKSVRNSTEGDDYPEYLSEPVVHCANCGSANSSEYTFCRLCTRNVSTGRPPG